MVKEVFVIRSSISSSLVRSTLFQGFAIAFLGILILLLAGIFMPVASLHKWGWILFLLSLGFVTLGLLPYRRLSYLQLHPDKLVLMNSDDVSFYSKGRKILTFPLQSVARMSYIQCSRSYGIAVWLKPTALIVIHQLPQEAKKRRNKGQKIEQADLFFPYFNQHAYHELMNWQREEDIS
jgi:hypothetical protein